MEAARPLSYTAQRAWNKSLAITRCHGSSGISSDQRSPYRCSRHKVAMTRDGGLDRTESCRGHAAPSGPRMGEAPPRDRAEAVRVGLEREPKRLDHRSALLMLDWLAGWGGDLPLRILERAQARCRCAGLSRAGGLSGKRDRRGSSRADSGGSAPTPSIVRCLL